MNILQTWRRNERIVAEEVMRGHLEIDDQGRIWRVGRYRGSSRITERLPRHRAERSSKTGYLRIACFRNGRIVSCLAHRLVWHLVTGQIPEGICINHKNGNKKDNRIVNLEAVTPAQNNQHRYDSGLTRQPRGDSSGLVKVPDADVRRIRELYASGDVSSIKIARMYGVSFQWVAEVVRGARRVEAGGPILSREAVGKIRGRHSTENNLARHRIIA